MAVKRINKGQPTNEEALAAQIGGIGGPSQVGDDIDVSQIPTEEEARQMIDEKKLNEFFKRGYSDKGEKRGYGLYNVRKICEEYHAAIVCKNEIRKGENGILFGIMVNKPL